MGRHVHASISYYMVTKPDGQDAKYICGSTGSCRWAGLMGQNLAFITHCLNVLSRSVFYRHFIDIGIDHQVAVIVSTPHLTASISYYMVSTRLWLGDCQATSKMESLPNGRT